MATAFPWLDDETNSTDSSEALPTVQFKSSEDTTDEAESYEAFASNIDALSLSSKKILQEKDDPEDFADDDINSTDGSEDFTSETEPVPLSSDYQFNPPPDVDDDLESYKRGADISFVTKKFVEAAFLYSRYLVAYPNDLESLANRSAAYIELDRFHLGLKDAEAVLDIAPNHSKAIYRKAKALCGLKRYSDAYHFLEERLKYGDVQQNRDEIAKLLVHCNTWRYQAREGKFDMVEILQSEFGEVLELGEYIGPVEIRDVGHKGRGLVATRQIKPGELVMASKAFAMAFANDSVDENLLAEVDSGIKDKLLEVARHKLISKLRAHLQEEPEAFEELLKLYAGENSEGLSKEELVSKIARYNGFSSNRNQHNILPNGYEFCGLWIHPSYINHSCVDCNCDWSIHGDLFLARAFRRIDPGREVLISYVSNVMPVPYQIRKDYFKYYDMDCNCRLCRCEKEDEKKKGVAQKRIELLGNKSENIEDMERVVRELEALTTPDSPVNLLHETAISKLVRSYISNENKTKGIQILQKWYDLLKESPLQHVAFIAMLYIAANFEGVGLKQLQKKLKTRALIAYGCLSVIDYFRDL